MVRSFLIPYEAFHVREPLHSDGLFTSSRTVLMPSVSSKLSDLRTLFISSFDLRPKVKPTQEVVLYSRRQERDGSISLVKIDNDFTYSTLLRQLPSAKGQLRALQFVIRVSSSLSKTQCSFDPHFPGAPIDVLRYLFSKTISIITEYELVDYLNALDDQFEGLMKGGNSSMQHHINVARHSLVGLLCSQKRTANDNDCKNSEYCDLENDQHSEDASLKFSIMSIVWSIISFIESNNTLAQKAESGLLKENIPDDATPLIIFDDHSAQNSTANVEVCMFPAPPNQPPPPTISMWTLTCDCGCNSGIIARRFISEDEVKVIPNTKKNSIDKNNEEEDYYLISFNICKTMCSYCNEINYMKEDREKYKKEEQEESQGEEQDDDDETLYNSPEFSSSLSEFSDYYDSSDSCDCQPCPCISFDKAPSISLSCEPVEGFYSDPEFVKTLEEVFSERKECPADSFDWKPISSSSRIVTPPPPPIQSEQRKKHFTEIRTVKTFSIPEPPPLPPKAHPSNTVTRITYRLKELPMPPTKIPTPPPLPTNSSQEIPISPPPPPPPPLLSAMKESRHHFSFMLPPKAPAPPPPRYLPPPPPPPPPPFTEVGVKDLPDRLYCISPWLYMQSPCTFPVPPPPPPPYPSSSSSPLSSPSSSSIVESESISVSCKSIVADNDGSECVADSCDDDFEVLTMEDLNSLSL